MTLDLGQIKFENIDKKPTGVLYTRWKYGMEESFGTKKYNASCHLAFICKHFTFY